MHPIQVSLLRPGPLLEDNLKLRLLRAFGRCEWIRFGVRYAIISRFWDPLTPRPLTFEVDYFGLRYRGDFEGYLDWYVYFFGTHEMEELYLLRDLVAGRPNAVFVDIGANTGNHALYMAQHCDQVHAFEPYAPVRERLIEGVERNGLDNISVHDVGLGARDEELDFYAPTGINNSTGSFLSTHEVENNELAGKLQVVAGDACLANLGLDQIDVIKIDVEGFEKDVLLGLRKTLAKLRPAVMMEFSTSTQSTFSDAEELLSFLPDDYRVDTVNRHNKLLGVFGRPSYRLIDFDFERPGSGLNILFRPQEGGYLSK